MGNQITNTLPPSLDKFLMDFSQTESNARITYNDIMKFGENVTEKEIHTLRNLKRKYLYHFDEDEETPEIIRCSIDINFLVLRK